jgi:hypothetical protein
MSMTRKLTRFRSYLSLSKYTLSHSLLTVTWSLLARTFARRLLTRNMTEPICGESWTQLSRIPSSRATLTKIAVDHSRPLLLDSESIPLLEVRFRRGLVINPKSYSESKGKRTNLPAILLLVRSPSQFSLIIDI